MIRIKKISDFEKDKSQKRQQAGAHKLITHTCNGFMHMPFGQELISQRPKRTGQRQNTPVAASKSTAVKTISHVYNCFTIMAKANIPQSVLLHIQFVVWSKMQLGLVAVSMNLVCFK